MVVVDTAMAGTAMVGTAVQAIGQMNFEAPGYNVSVH
jgi:hypothetical protein